MWLCTEIGCQRVRARQLRQDCRPAPWCLVRRFATIGTKAAEGLKLRRDHGSNRISQDFQQELTFLGIGSSRSFARKQVGGRLAERFICTR